MFILAAILFAAAIVFFATCAIATQYERAVVFRLTGVMSARQDRGFIS